MAAVDTCLLDSNILLRMSKSDDPHYPAIRAAMLSLGTRGAQFAYTSQRLGEFWNAATRPIDRNGFGLSVAETDLIARIIERDFRFLPDSQAVHNRWRQLRVMHEVKGVQVHDARLAASMYLYGISQLLTLNPRYFARYSELKIMTRADVPAIKTQ